MSWTAPSGHVWTTGEVVSAANMNTYIANNLTFLYGDTAWTTPTLSGTWVAFGGAEQAPRFRLLGTRVYIEGSIKSGTINTAAFTLPTGYRPPATMDFATASNLALGIMSVTAGGVVTPVVGSNVEFWLNCNFDTF